MHAAHPPAAHGHGLSRAGWWLLVLAAILLYAYNLGGQYNPSNGDELVYAHIARLTAQSGHWLPLVSDLEHMRNTKPPLLFWQAMVAGDWGRHWSLAALRTPSLIYTLLVSALIAMTALRLTGRSRQAALAVCIYLAFFCTYRYGRSYLTSAPESFWYSLPLFWVLWRSRAQGAVAGAQAHPARLGWLAHGACGLLLGIGLAYKSFALILPCALGLWVIQLDGNTLRDARTLLTITAKVALSSVLALAVFGLWFVLDPDPAAVWHEFVVGENAGKLVDAGGYWREALLGGGSSVWAQSLAYVQNAGLLALPVLGLLGYALRSAWRGQSTGLGPTAEASSPEAVRILLLWLSVWLLVFCVPSQRSARYVIPAMPALALLLSLYWQRIARAWFLGTSLLCALLALALGRIAWAAYSLGLADQAALGQTLLVCTLTAVAALAGLARARWSRACSLAACLGVYGALACTGGVFDGPGGHYDDALQRTVREAKIAVPSSFNAQFERYFFLLPGNDYRPYDGESRQDDPGARAAQLQQLLQTHDAVVWLPADPAQSEPPCRPQCQVWGWRWEVQGRHRSGEITFSNLWQPQIWLFRKEWLLSTRPPPGACATP